jgi:hypothetical protein
MKAKTKQQATPEPGAESDGGNWQNAVKKLIEIYFPNCDNAAVVIEPGGDMPPVVVPVAGDIPSCIDCTSWQKFSGHYVARGC